MVIDIKGYVVPFGYVGFVGKTRVLFATEEEYREFMLECDAKNENDL